MRRLFLIFLLALISSSGFSQKSALEKSLRTGHWLVQFDPLTRFASDAELINRTVEIEKIPSLLRNKKKRPLKFKRSGIVKSPQPKPFCCGTVGTFESLFALKWRESGTWMILEENDEQLLHYSRYTLKLVNSKQSKHSFVIVAVEPIVPYKPAN